MMEGRKEEFTAELKKTSKQPSKASREVEQAIDRVVYYAGWCDKYQQIFSAVNPVASSHFNFSVLEPVGVVAGIAPEKGGLLGLISMLMPIIAGGNTIVVLASEESPQVAMTLAEVLNVADLPGGVVNILTGKKTELFSHFASHMEVNALALGEPLGEAGDGFKMTANNVKRVISYEKNWSLPQAQGPYFISDFQEVKTTWHPVEQTGAGKASY